MRDVIIIGGGYAGLSVGAILTHRGFSVLLFEKKKTLGGRARMQEKEGFLLDYGIHSHRGGERGPLAEVFREIGEPIRFAGPPHYDSCIFRDGRLVPIPVSPGGYLASREYTLRDKLVILGIFLKILRSRPQKWYQKSLADFLGLKRTTPSLDAFSRFLSLIVMVDDPLRASAGEIIDIIRMAVPARRKVADLIGGSGQIIETFRGKILKNGEIMTSTPVNGVTLGNGKISSVLTEHGEFSARSYIFAAPLNQITRIIPEDALPPALVNYARNLFPTAGLSIDFGLTGMVSDVSGSIFAFHPIVIGNFPSNGDPTRAPRGKQLATWLCTIPHPVKKEGVIQAEHHLRKTIRAIFPTFFTRVEWERKLLHPMMDGVFLRPGQAFPDRPEVTLSTISNLFLAGDTVRGRGTGGDIAFSSALSAAREVERRLASWP